MTGTGNVVDVSNVIVSSTPLGNVGYCLQVNHTSGGGGWLTLNFSAVDISTNASTPYSALSFWVKGQNGGEFFAIDLRSVAKSEPPDHMRLRVKDFLPNGVTTAWQKVTIPVRALTPYIDAVGLTDINGIVLDFNQDGPGAGTIYIDDIVFHTKTAPLYIDNFEDGTDPNALRSTTTATNDGNAGNISSGAYTSVTSYTGQKSFWMGFNVGGTVISTVGARINFLLQDDIYKGKKVDVGPSSNYLYFVMKGTDALSQNLRIELADGTTTNFRYINSYSALTNNWQTYSIPLTDFPSVDLTKISTLSFILSTLNTNATFYIDDIKFIDKSTPTAPSNILASGQAVASGMSIFLNVPLSVTAQSAADDPTLEHVRFEHDRMTGGTSWYTIGVDTDTTDGTYQATWNTGALPGGSTYRVRAVAMDVTGNEGRTTPITDVKIEPVYCTLFAVSTISSLNPRPGDVIITTITYANTSGAAIANATITCVVPSSMTLYEASSIGDTDRTQYLVNGSWQYPFSPIATKIRWTDDSIPANSAGLKVAQKLKVKDGVPVGTSIRIGGDQGNLNQDDEPGDILLSYTGATAPSTAAIANLVISTGYALASLSSPENKGVNPGSWAYYSYSIVNAANAADTVSLSVSTTAGKSWNMSIFRDDNSDGSHQASESSVITSLALSAGATGYLFLGVQIPSTANEGEYTVIRLAAKNQSGTGTEENWPVAGNDSLTDDTTTTASVDLSSPVIVYSDRNPSGSVVLGNKVLIQATITDPESGVSLAQLHYRINSSSEVVIQLSTISANLYSTDLTNQLQSELFLSYYVTALNSRDMISTAAVIASTFTNFLTQSDFLSGTISLKNSNPNDGQTQIVIPDGAFAVPVNITVRRIDASLLPARPSFADDQPVSAIEINVSEGNLKTPATLTLWYPDFNPSDGIADGTPIKETDLKLFWHDGIQWRLLGGTIDESKNTITAKVHHFSIFAAIPATSINAEEWRPKQKVITPALRDGVNDFLVFEGLPDGTEIKIYDVSGRCVKTFNDTNSWDGKDSGNNVVESGIYLYQFKSGGKWISGTVAVMQ